ncbi:MAG: ornithine cyclodeaminase family protein [Actinomycetota bacterium]|nr:ornithine cyclodeaminase family protein [Actinomycetota bacterium]
MIRLIDADELRRVLPMAAAIDALEAAFRDEDPSRSAPLRSSVATPAGTLLLMPAAGERGVGVKLVTLTEFNPQRGLPFIHGAYVLFDRETQRPEAMIDGTELTAIRTAALSGLATRNLARVDARRLVIFGAGVQAAAHLEAMVAVVPLEEVVIVSRTLDPALALVERARGMGMQASVGEPSGVAQADLVCTCTTSGVSLFDGRLLAEGAHVNAVGSYLPDQRELDTETVRRAKVVVETREVALAEAGDLLIPIAEGTIGPEHIVADLAEVVRGSVVRTADNDVTVFESVGMAFEDLVVARAALDAGS